MSIFDKFMGLFREEIEEDEIKPKKPEQTKEMTPITPKRPTATFKKKADAAQEVATKISYQYPTRELNSHPIAKEFSRARRRERQEYNSRQWEPDQIPLKEDRKLRLPVETDKEDHGTAKAWVSPRPFSPTEIPSPIYGFKERPSRQEARRLFKITEAEEKPLVPDNLREEEIIHHVKNKQEQAVKKEQPLRQAPMKTGQIIEETPKNAAGAAKPEPLLLFAQDESSKVFDIEDRLVPAVPEKKPVLIEKELAEQLPEAVLEPELVQETPIRTSIEAVSPVTKEKTMDASAAPMEIPAPHDNKEGKLPDTRRSAKRVRPFNVLMNKQDRDRLNTQKKSDPAEPVKKPGAWDKGNKVVEEETAPVLPAASAEMANRETAMEVKPSETAVMMESAPETEINYYEFPKVSYLTPPVYREASGEWVKRQSHVLNETFKNFNVKAKVVNITVGPSVTRFEVEPEPGVKVSKITNLSDDIKLSLAARNIRIEAPIPGTHLIGIEVPNKESRPVLISEIIKSPEFEANRSPLASALGLDISGEPVVLDLKKMPHGLIAGATGSGKSVCINSILVSLLYKAAPHELKLLLIDPKMVELAPYNGIPHLVSPVITDVKAATAALKWAVEEMERRYELFVHSGVRDISKFNEKVEKLGNKSEHLPYIVIIIDELADLMMMSPADVEEAICRIAQKARACGIHLIVATQRPSVDVITGLIKANIPTRIAFSVSSQVDSRTIIDTGGAEKLLGRGDMLFLNNGSSESVRLQGTFVSDDEIDTVVEHARREQKPNYLFKQEELLEKAQIEETEDELFPEACEYIVRHGGASASLLQRHFKIGYNRASRLMELMEAQGFVSEQRAGRQRDVLITEEQLQTLQDSSPVG